jgi:UDP-galactopyranose mutase
MDTFYELWGITDPAEAEARIRAQAEGFLQGKEPSNFEEQAVSMAGTDIYGKIIKGYSMKQWGRDCRDLPASIIKRLRISFDHDGDYYGERHEGIPAEGYTSMIDNMLKGITVITGVDYEDPDVRETAGNIADRIIYTGSIDSYYSYCFGTLEYRSVRFDEIRLDGIEFYQDRAVVNNADPGTAYTRETEHRYFDPESCRKELGFTIVSREFPEEYDGHNEAMYPLRDERNLSLYRRYRELANDDPKLFFGGRLGTYRYLDMDDVIESALADSAELLKNNASENNSK